ncbi:leucine--tRNA ligase [Ornithinimicrobium pekingense]|uniref:Leucine--tRNA ligase n=1 Tax=Ornithinimicrobium pekingense TaxID=384677 RepID=A0ABQ2F7W6_9MICO|nr:leucine--tRNA ligase [Ornithinimicrobium pekingense]GGK67540.1 leucine--tRNA ligase [Ornithinimicrobium pekingense]
MSERIPEHRYTAALANEIEARWQERWEAEDTFASANPAGPWADPDDPRLGQGHRFIMDMFPYPSGTGLHVGHPLGFIATDVHARFARTTGMNVLHTMGFDAFGLPAEQYAVQTGQHPRVTTERNMEIYRAQLRRLGMGHEQRRSFATIDPGYYRWTQWIFTQIFESWYDVDAPARTGEGTGRARPIRELVAQFASGERDLDLHDDEGRPRTWADLSPVEQADVLDGYRLAYLSSAPVNWCPGLGTVLSNEEVTADGRSERGNFPVFKRNLSQWMMRITAYADRLTDDLDRLDWPEKVKLMQRNWIGRSVGATVRFDVPSASSGHDGTLPLHVFTTRPDTLFGATFMVVAPEHPSLAEIVPDAWPEGTDPRWTDGAPDPRTAVTAYQRMASTKSDVERQADAKTKTGVFTGAFATNPVDGRQVPVFVADYVLMGYGTGAIMAVPGQDQRDWDFAVAYGLPIIRTVQPTEGHPEDQAFTGEGPAVNSANDEVSLDGLGVAEAKERIIAWLVERGLGRETVTYRLRDWLFSRQRYWGEPFPVVWDEDGVAHTVPDEMLPVELPDVPDYSPRTYEPEDADSSPEAPLARATDWVEVELDLGDGRGVRRYRRETNTMPNWAGSCWYHLRYLDPANEDALVDPTVERYWIGPRPAPVAGAPAGATDPGGVDLYVGGVEHAVLHLLYSRFWHKVLFDLGYVSSEEPFRRLINQGMIEAYVYRDARGFPVPAAEVEEVPDPEGGAPTFTWQGEPVTQEYGKMGKSLKNVVTPDEMCEQYGADTFRVYEMSMGPLEQYRPWETRAVVGSMRFLQRLWRNVVDEETGELTVTDDPMDVETEKALHRTIAGVRADYEALRTNTAIAKMIELNNHLTKLPAAPRAAVEPLVQMVAPVAPHVAEELWSRLGHEGSLAWAPFPEADPQLLVEDTVTCVVQVRGKVRDRLEVAADVDEATLQELALASPKVQAIIDGAPVRKVIVRAPGLVNIVV